jgi:hypothetical protein
MSAIDTVSRLDRSNPVVWFHSLQIAVGSPNANVVVGRTAHWILPTVPAVDGGGTQ